MLPTAIIVTKEILTFKTPWSTHVFFFHKKEVPNDGDRRKILFNPKVPLQKSEEDFVN
jgi:ABC-type histidine transport system ATPase subunit